MDNVIWGKQQRNFVNFMLAIGTRVISVLGYLIFGPNCKVRIDGEHLSDTPRLHAQEFKFARFRFDYFLQKTNPQRNSQNQITTTVSINYKDYPPLKIPHRQ